MLRFTNPSDPKSALVLLLHCQSVSYLPCRFRERAQNKGLASCGASGLKEAWINLLGLIRWRTVSQRMTSLRCNAALCAGLYSSRPLKLIVWVTHNPGGLSQIFVILVSLMRKQTAGECDWWNCCRHLVLQQSFSLEHYSKWHCMTVASRLQLFKQILTFLSLYYHTDRQETLSNAKWGKLDCTMLQAAFEPVAPTCIIG